MTTPARFRGRRGVRWAGIGAGAHGLILLLIMVANLLALLFGRPILAVLKPRVLQMLGLVLGIIQLALGLGLLFTSFEVQALTIRELLR